MAVRGIETRSSWLASSIEPRRDGRGASRHWQSQCVPSSTRRQQKLAAKSQLTELQQHQQQQNAGRALAAGFLAGAAAAGLGLALPCRRWRQASGVYAHGVSTQEQDLEALPSQQDASSSSAAPSRPQKIQKIASPMGASSVTDILADSFIRTFNNVFLNTIETVRTQHLTRVLDNLRAFAARVPAKYRPSIQKALSAEGFLSFLLARASVSLLCAKATLPSSSAPAGTSPMQLTKEHEDLATVVEELYIAAMLHSEKEWEMEIKADGKTFVAVAAAFTARIAAPDVIQRENIQSALKGLGKNATVWSKYGFDLLHVAFGESFKEIFYGSSSSQLSSSAASSLDQQKLSLLGGCSLYATAQWAMANVDSHKCRKAIAETISKYSDGQLCKREVLWNCDLKIHEYLELEKLAGVAAFFQASAQCAAYMNGTADGIAEELAAFGVDIGLIIGLYRHIRPDDIDWALQTGKLTAPIIFAIQHSGCSELRPLLERRLSERGDRLRARKLIMNFGIEPTICLVRRLGARACARLEVLEDSPEKKTLLTLTQGIACISEDTSIPESIDCCFPTDSPSSAGVASNSDGNADLFASQEIFDLQVRNLELAAKLQRVTAASGLSSQRMDRLKEAMSVADPSSLSSSSSAAAPGVGKTMSGLGVAWDPRELQWLLFLGLDKQAPAPDSFDDLQDALEPIQHDRERVQARLLSLPDAAVSSQLKAAVQRVFESSGKCLRSALCLLVHDMLRQDSQLQSATRRVKGPVASDSVLTLATAIEVIHSASLVHDDVLDDAEFRRQKSTVHMMFGREVAVLTGDFLFAHASAMVESLEEGEVTRMVSLVIEEFGVGEMSQGALRFNADIDLFQYLNKTFYKTASLIAAACRASAVLTGCEIQVCDAVYSYGFYLGMAFQIADDILDFTADGMEQLGKPAAADLKDGNLTAPVILCLRGSEELGISPAPCAGELRKLIQGRLTKEEDLARAVELVHEGDGIAKAFQLADKMADKALQALALVSNGGEAGVALASLPRWAVRRSS